MRREKTGFIPQFRSQFRSYALLSICFALGAVGGLWVAIHPEWIERYGLASRCSINLFSGPLEQALASAGIYLLALFAACSLLSPVLIPALTIGYGFCHSFSSYFYLSGRGAIPGALVMAILPQLVVGVPIFLYCEAEAFRFSASVLHRIVVGNAEFSLSGSLARMCGWIFAGMLLSSGAAALGGYLAGLI